ncbi:hypothetical protein K443DRAFT_194062 [Laccaria amethystina LaAM-08-1]|uniref:Uncharacterized protein n=1 Tax=Laccaria amethystina LaAM-08-1 TaxID=1095629 RepID=A0A0C9X160_9AGAR|nr:hypothetical protein K443DRAFT_194062 [Laccaria amethystina LaAM-08-1]
MTSIFSVAEPSSHEQCCSQLLAGDPFEWHSGTLAHGDKSRKSSFTCCIDDSLGSQSYYDPT